MKLTVNVYLCDFCGDEIDKHKVGSVLPIGHGFIQGRGYQNVVVDGNKNLIICSECCRVVKHAIESGFVVMREDLHEQMMLEAGYRKDGDGWIPLSLYNIRKEEGLLRGNE